MIEEIVGIGAEGVGVEHPAAEGDAHAELAFFIALAVERDKSAAIGLGTTEAANPKPWTAGAPDSSGHRTRETSS